MSQIAWRNGFNDVSEESGKDATCEERPGGREEG